MPECGKGYYDENFVEHLSRFTGETVTIFTKSGGMSGCGFTGVILHVNSCFCRLITCVGPAPGCALGNACSRCSTGFGTRRWDRRTVGSVVDIPIDSIASFVHNAV
jgi:hypothetical protein